MFISMFGKGSKQKKNVDANMCSNGDFIVKHDKGHTLWAQPSSSYHVLHSVNTLTPIANE